MRGISQFCNAKSKEEETAHLREETMAHFPIIHGRIDEEIRNREAHEVKVENQI
jgi:queuine/archaeosine tRNA-ribosyltransferase